MSPVDPFEQDVRAMLRRRASDIAGDLDHPGMPELSIEKAPRQGWRSALLVGATAAVTLLVGLAVVLPRLGDDDLQIVIAGPPESVPPEGSASITTDGSPSTNDSVGIHSAAVLIPEVNDRVVGAWDLSVPSADQLPAGTDLGTAPVLFSGGQDVSNVAAQYLADRLNEDVFSVTWRLVAEPAGSFSIRPEEISESSAVWRWIGPLGSTIENGGWIYLRWEGHGWGVVAATTDGVDFSGIEPKMDGFTGEVVITSGHDYYMFVVGDPTAPCISSSAGLTCGENEPHPKLSGRSIRLGVGTRSQPRVLRVYEVEGSTLLSITELSIEPSPPLQEPAEPVPADEADLDSLFALNPNRMVFKGDSDTVLVWEAGVWTEFDLGEDVDFPWLLDGGSWIQAGNVFVSLIPEVDDCSVPDGVNVYGHIFLDGEVNRLALITGITNNNQFYECATGGSPTVEPIVEPLHSGWARLIVRPNGTFTVKSELESPAKISFDGRDLTGDDWAMDVSVSRTGNTVAYATENGAVGHFTNKVVARSVDGELLGSWELGSDEFVFGLWALDNAIVVRLASYEFMLAQDRTPPDTYVSIDISSGKVSALSSVTGLLWIG